MKRVMRDVLIFWCVLVVSAFLIVNFCHAEEKTVDTEFIAVSSYLVLMTVFDVETTFSAIHNGAQEANPIMKPFAKNRAYMYGVQLGVDALVIWLAYEMKKSEQWRPVWWIVPSVVGTAHGVCAGLNLRYVW